MEGEVLIQPPASSFPTSKRLPEGIARIAGKVLIKRLPRSSARLIPHFQDTGVYVIQTCGARKGVDMIREGNLIR